MSFKSKRTKRLKTHEKRFEDYIEYQKRVKSLTEFHITSYGGFDNPSHQAKELLNFCRDGDNPEKCTPILEL